MHPPRILVLVTILGALLSGCAPTPVQTPSPVPTVPVCTPEFEGTPYPCTQADYEANQKMLARYAEAERVFRRYNDLYARESVERRPEPSPDLLELTTGKYRANLAELRQRSLEMAEFSGRLDVASMKPTELLADDLGSLAMIACVDRSGWVVAFKDGTAPSQDPISAERVQFDEGSGVRVVGLDLVEASECA